MGVVVAGHGAIQPKAKGKQRKKPGHFLDGGRVARRASPDRRVAPLHVLRESEEIVTWFQNLDFKPLKIKVLMNGVKSWHGACKMILPSPESCIGKHEGATKQTNQK
jgi:hypothetical protein